MTKALSDHRIAPAAVEWFNWGESNFTPHLDRIRAANADVILLVANAPEGKLIIQSMAQQGEPLPLVSHWGITGGDLWQEVNTDLSRLDLLFLQTFSYLPPQNERAAAFVEKYFTRYNIDTPPKMRAPVGVAHAYDLTHLLAMAIEKAGSTEREKVRDAMEQLSNYSGVVKNYVQPFSPTRHDALDQSDFFLARYDEYGRIVKYEEKDQ